MVCLATEESYYILSFDSEQVQKARDNNEVAEDGVESAFDVLGEVNESVRTGLWVGDCFIYTNAVNRINYFVGGELVTIAHLDRPLYVLGYIPKDDRLYLADKELGVVSYQLLLSVRILLNCSILFYISNYLGSRISNRSHAKGLRHCRPSVAVHSQRAQNARGTFPGKTRFQAASFGGVHRSGAQVRAGYCSGGSEHR